jgi:hypothetical protein
VFKFICFKIKIFIRKKKERIQKMGDFDAKTQLKELSAQQIYEYLVNFQIPEEIVRERFLSKSYLKHSLFF